MQFKTAIFDLDGTLLDSMPMWATACSDYVRSCGIFPDSDLDSTVISFDMPHTADYVRKNYMPDRSNEDIARDINDFIKKKYIGVPLKAGALEFLEAIKKRGVKICLASATDRFQVIEILKIHGLYSLFDGIMTCPEVGPDKSDSALVYERAMALVDGNRETTYVFEDADYAIRTAVSADFNVVCIYDDLCRNSRSEMKKICRFYFENWKQASEVLL